MQLLPHLLTQRLIDQTLQWFLGQVPPLGIEQGADQHMLTIGRQVQRQTLAVVARGIALEPTRRVEATHYLGPTAFDSLDSRRQLIGLGQWRQQQAEQG